MYAHVTCFILLCVPGVLGFIFYFLYMVFCIEILGEDSFHKFLVQSGWSGRDYIFYYNKPTSSHLRAYRSLADYLAERLDIHKASNIWPLLANLIAEGLIESHVFVQNPCGENQQPLVAETESEVKRGDGDAVKKEKPTRKKRVSKEERLAGHSEILSMAPMIEAGEGDSV